MPDKYAIHGYEAERDRHKANALRALDLAKSRIESAIATWERDDPSSLLAYDARNAAQLTAEAWAETQAFLALHEVRFLTERTEGET